MNLERVEWRDAFFDFDVKSVDDLRDEYLVETCGWVIDEDETWLHLAQEVLPDGEGFRGVTHLPQVLIQHRWLLITAKVENDDKAFSPVQTQKV